MYEIEGPRVAHPVGLRPGCPDREVDLLCCRTSVAPRRVTRSPAPRAAARSPRLGPLVVSAAASASRRARRRPGLPGRRRPGLPGSSTLVVGVHLASCPAPSAPRSPAAPASEVALRWTRWSCPVRCRGVRSAASAAVSRCGGVGLPRAFLPFLDPPCSVPAPSRTLRSDVSRDRSQDQSRPRARRPAPLLDRAARLAGLPARRRPESPPAGPPVSLGGGVVLRPYPQGAQGVSTKFLELSSCPQDVHRTGACRAPDVPTLSPDPCTGPRGRRGDEFVGTACDDAAAGEGSAVAARRRRTPRGGPPWGSSARGP